jgi:hypothetical protein
VNGGRAVATDVQLIEVALQAAEPLEDALDQDDAFGPGGGFPLSS